MLAHIFLAQKDYQKSLNCLNKITVSDEISPLARDLFTTILASSAAIHDYSPNASALRLRAFLLVKKLDPFASGYRQLQVDQDPFAAHKSVVDIYNTYLEGLNHIWQPLRLSVDLNILLPASASSQDFFE